MANELLFSTPRGFVYQDSNGKVELAWDANFGKKTTKKFTEAQKFIDSECIRYCAPLTPLRTSALIKSATLGTVIGSGRIEYVAPYARRQYYENKGKGQRGKLWFERMKAKRKKVILYGAAKIVGAKT